MQRHNPVSLSLLLFLFGLLILPSFISAQSHQIPLNKTFGLGLENALLKAKPKAAHYSFQPLLESQLKALSGSLDSVQPILSIQKRMEYRGWKRKLLYEHLFILDTQTVELTLDPLYNFEYTYQRDGPSETLFKNGRGFLLRLQIGKNFAIGSSFRENQVRLPSYLADRVDATDVAYGQGRVKRIDSANYDFAMSSSYLSYSPHERLNITIGHGKHFIGHGYRSHLLSDQSFNYPYLRLNSNWWQGKLQYQNLYALFQDLERLPSKRKAEELFERKFSAMHYLSYSPISSFSIGFFESNIWPSIDSSGKRELSGAAYIPVIFMNSLLDNSPKTLSSLVGIDLRINPGRQWLLYGQLSSKDLKDGLHSAQAGLKYYLMDGFRLGVEYNIVAADTSFAHSHYNESLTLPYAGVGRQEEIIASAQYQRSRMIYLFRSNFFSSTVNQRFIMAEVSFIVNPSMNSTLFISGTHRDRDDLMFVSFGWRTNLQNLYFDY